MRREEALALLEMHSFRNEDIYHPKMEKGFLGMLRPFTGELYEKNFHEMMRILWALREDLQSDNIDREINSSLFSICHFARMWGLDPGGMLQRNNLLSTDQIAQLQEWVDTISYTISNLLEGDEGEAFHGYCGPRE